MKETTRGTSFQGIIIDRAAHGESIYKDNSTHSPAQIKSPGDNNQIERRGKGEKRSRGSGEKKSNYSTDAAPWLEQNQYRAITNRTTSERALPRPHNQTADENSSENQSTTTQKRLSSGIGNIKQTNETKDTNTRPTSQQ